MKPGTEMFRHYRIVTRADGRVSVYDPRYPNSASLYNSDTIEDARRFVTGYRDGQLWAMSARLSAHQGEKP